MSLAAVIDAMRDAEQALANPVPDNLMLAATTLAGAAAAIETRREYVNDPRVRRRLHNLNLLLAQASRLRLAQQNWSIEA